VGETPTDVDHYTFDPFARHPFYHQINRALVRRAVGRLDAVQPPGEVVRVVDLASGTGAVTHLIVDELAQRGRLARMTGIEPSGKALAVAREGLQGLQGCDVQFEQGDAEQLAQVVVEADAVFFCNAIHLIADKPAVLAQIARVLRAGGFFVCNSAYFDGAAAPGSEHFTHLWIRRALGRLRQHHPDIHPTRRGQRTALAWLSADEYATLLEAQGLRVVDRVLEVTAMPVRAVQDIGRYQLFIEGALPGVPIPIGADALEWAAAAAARELNMTEVARVWLQLVAQRSEREQARGQ
jgi:ubiquinone/menaquinone biosynthesis C-methylase UbiE